MSLELSQISNYSVNRKFFSQISIIDTSLTHSEEQKNKSKKYIKKIKWRNVTSELAMFTVKPESSVLIDPPPFTSYNFDAFIEEYEDDEVNYVEEEDNEYKKKIILKRPKKANKRTKIKTLLKKNSLLPQLNISSNLASKYGDIFKYVKFTSNSKLYIKYNVFNKLFICDDTVFDYYFIRKCDRTMHVFAQNKEKPLDANQIKKHNFKIKTRTGNSDNKLSKHQQDDIPLLNPFIIDHNRVNEEINQTYDQQYIELLISMQHRDLTPEDYENLARLDELIKKKTVSDQKLKQLKCEKVNSDNVNNFISDLCTICMEGYLIDQVRKHLPCGHIFHSDCIDEWLSSNSTKCPLDQLSLID